MFKTTKFHIEKTSSGYFGSIHNEPILSSLGNVIYAPNASLIQLMIDENYKLSENNLDPSLGTIFRMISNAVDAAREKKIKVSVKELIGKDSYIQIQQLLTIEQSKNLFPIISDILSHRKLEQLRLNNLNRKHFAWIRDQIKSLNTWERSFIMEMGKKGFTILSLAFLNNHLTLPLYSEYCLLSQGVNPTIARNDFQRFLNDHLDELKFLKLIVNES